MTRARYLMAAGLAGLAGLLGAEGWRRRNRRPAHELEEMPLSEQGAANHWDGPLRHLIHVAERGGGSGHVAQVADETAIYEDFQYGMQLLQSGNPAQAAIRLEKARYAVPRKSSVREALGRAYFELGRLKDAECEFRTVVEVDPTNDYAHYCLARVLQRLGRFKQADVHLKLARAMSPGEERYRRWSEN